MTVAMVATRRPDADPATVAVALRHLAVSGLADLDVDLGPFDTTQWRTLVDEVQRHRLVGVLAAAARAGGVDLDEAQQRELATKDETWQSHALAMERLLIDVVTVLDANAIAYRVIKGPALAHTAAFDPAQRTFGDIDVVVCGAALSRSRALLVDRVGAVDILPEVRPGFDAHFAKDVLLRVDNTEIDLHRTLAAGPFGMRIDPIDLFDRPAQFHLGARAVDTLSPELTALQVCYNAALGDVPQRLGSLRDVALVLHRLDPDPAIVADLTDRWGATAVVRHAIESTWTRLQPDPHPIAEWAMALQPSRRDHRLLEASISTQRSYTRQLAAVGSVRGLRAKGEYLHGLIRPSAAYLEARGWGRGDHVARAARRLLAARR